LDYFWNNSLIIYLKLKDLEVLNLPKGHALIGLRNTIPLLILFQILRIISAKTQGLELVSPGGKLDLFDNRRITTIDFIMFVIYVAVTVLLLAFI